MRHQRLKKKEKKVSRMNAVVDSSVYSKKKYI